MDQTGLFVELIRSAADNNRQVRVSGHGSKGFCLPEVSGEMLSVVEHTGVIEYQPEELVITVRAGTPLHELQRTVYHERQRLGAEPPEFAGLGTIGGAVASGFSGPGRPWLGSMRDCVLGIEMINGRGEHLRFGGQVMKNVAGYDVSRLNAGAFSSLGLILSVSLRLNPLPEHEWTLRYDMACDAAIEFCRRNARKPHPITATFWHDNRLYVRLSGTENALSAAHDRLGGERVVAEFWPGIRDHRHPAFADESEGGLVRIICPPNAPLNQTSPIAFEWGGGLRWYQASDELEEYARSVRGWLWNMGQAYEIELGQKMLMQNIRKAFDPDGVFVSPLNFETPDED